LNIYNGGSGFRAAVTFDFMLTLKNVRIGHCASGAAAVTGQHLLILENISIHDCDFGVSGSSSTNVEVINTSFDNISRTAIVARNLNATNTTFSGCSTCISGTLGSVAVSDCQFLSSETGLSSSTPSIFKVIGSKFQGLNCSIQLTGPGSGGMFDLTDNVFTGAVYGLLANDVPKTALTATISKNSFINVSAALHLSLTTSSQLNINDNTVINTSGRVWPIVGISASDVPVNLTGNVFSDVTLSDATSVSLYFGISFLSFTVAIGCPARASRYDGVDSCARKLVSFHGHGPLVSGLNCLSPCGGP
jgi:hypothetical protein